MVTSGTPLQYVIVDRFDFGCVFDNNVPFDNTTPIYLINLLRKLWLGLELSEMAQYWSNYYYTGNFWVLTAGASLSETPVNVATSYVLLKTRFIGLLFVSSFLTAHYILLSIFPVAARAFQRWCELLVTRPLICGSTISATRAVPVDYDAFSYPYPTRAEDFYPRLVLGGTTDCAPR